MTAGTVEKWLCEFTEEELSNIVVLDRKGKCECHNFKSKGPMINDAPNNKLANLKKQKLFYKATWYYTAQLYVICLPERNWTINTIFW